MGLILPLLNTDKTTDGTGAADPGADRLPVQAATRTPLSHSPGTLSAVEPFLFTPGSATSPRAPAGPRALTCPSHPAGAPLHRGPSDAPCL